ncbi:MAG TPA: ANTAR domain-containing protein, partial [Mycobacteriales bacterium]
RARVGAALAAAGIAEHAGITLLNRGKFTTRAASSDLPPRVDAIQYELGSGPCVDAVLDDAVYRSGDLRTDTRWPQFGYRAATEVGVNSMLAFRLFLEDDDTLAGLNFYSTVPDAFDGNARMTGSVFATHAAIAMAAASRHEHLTHLEQALEHSREIGIAVGILMTRRLLTSDQAFDLLRMASQHTHRKLRDIAADVGHTGTLDLPATEDR